MAYGWRGEGLSSEGEPERMSGRADSIGRTYQDDSERSSRRKANEAETGWSQPAHKLQTRPPAKVLATRISMSHLVPLLEFNHCGTSPVGVNPTLVSPAAKYRAAARGCAGV